MKKTVMKMPIAKTNPVDQWVGQTTSDVSEAPKSGQVVPMRESAEVIKRLTIDVPESLHKRIKAQCAMRGANMAEVVRELLEREFPSANV